MRYASIADLSPIRCGAHDAIAADASRKSYATVTHVVQGENRSATCVPSMSQPHPQSSLRCPVSCERVTAFRPKWMMTPTPPLDNAENARSRVHPLLAPRTERARQDDRETSDALPESCRIKRCWADAVTNAWAS